MERIYSSHSGSQTHYHGKVMSHPPVMPMNYEPDCLSHSHRLEQERKQAAKQQEANSSEPKPKKDKKRKRDGEDVSAAEPSADVASTKSKAVGHSYFLEP